LAYPLGGQFQVPHGIANALLLPYVLEYNVVADVHKFAKVAEAIGEDISVLSAKKAAERAIESVGSSQSMLGYPRR
jgi:alcohol dehydrogenase class IV